MVPLGVLGSATAIIGALIFWVIVFRGHMINTKKCYMEHVANRCFLFRYVLSCLWFKKCRVNGLSLDCQYQFMELLRYKGRLAGQGFRHLLSMILHEKGYDSAEIGMLFAHMHIDKNASVAHIGRREMM